MTISKQPTSAATLEKPTPYQERRLSWYQDLLSYVGLPEDCSKIQLVEFEFDDPTSLRELVRRGGHVSATTTDKAAMDRAYEMRDRLPESQQWKLHLYFEATDQTRFDANYAHFAFAFYSISTTDLPEIRRILEAGGTFLHVTDLRSSTVNEWMTDYEAAGLSLRKMRRHEGDMASVLTKR